MNFGYDPAYVELYADLYTAFRRASRRKRQTRNCILFTKNWERNLADLAHDIMARTYRPHTSTRFVVTQPVPREVIAADFRERVVHHYVASFLNPYLERLLIHDCYSCRNRKGVTFGVHRLEHHIRCVSQNYRSACFVLKLDISGYFMSIYRPLLLEKVERMLQWIGSLKDPETEVLVRDTARFENVSYLAREIVNMDPMENCEYHGDVGLLNLLPPSKSLACSAPDCGLPIGNLTSQMFSNLYLNDFDHWMKDTLGLRHYGRYVDDFYVVGSDPEQLRSLLPAITERLATMERVVVHPKKVELCNIYYGVPYLGSFVLPYRRYILKKSLRRLKRKIRQANTLPPEMLSDPYTRFFMMSSTNSYLGAFCRARSYNLRSRYFKDHVLLQCASPDEYLRKMILQVKPNPIMFKIFRPMKRLVEEQQKKK